MECKIIAGDGSAFWMRYAGPRALHAAVRECGGELRAVGGAVRDYLLGEVIGDIDFGCDLSPRELCAVAESLSVSVRLHGVEHGTVMFIFDGVAYEVTSLRRDVRTFGRRAEVVFGSDWGEDAIRRDFTINALCMDSGGKIYDYCGGYEDLLEHAGGPLIRFVGDAEARVGEDYLRILRFFRLHAQLSGSCIDAVGLRVCGAHRGGLDGLSVERKAAELLKLLRGNAGSVLWLMQEHAILSQLGLQYRHDFAYICDLREALHVNSDDTAKLYLLSLIAPQDKADGKVAIADFVVVWRLSNRYRQILQAAWGISEYLMANEALEDIFRDSQDYCDYLALKHMQNVSANVSDCLRLGFLFMLYLQMSAGKDLTSHYQNCEAVLKFLDSWQMHAFPIKGGDIAQALGLKGEAIGRYLKQAEDYWLNHPHRPRPQARELLQYLRSQAQKEGLV